MAGTLFPRIKYPLNLVRHNGLRYGLNYFHFHLFYGTKNSLLTYLLYLATPYPSYLEIEVTTRCNLRCIICEHTYWKEKAREMSWEEFKSIIDQFPKLKWIGLTGIGESFLHPDFLRMLKLVKSRNIYVELYDNLYFIDKNISAELISLKIDRILASVDGATKETYEKIRVGSDFKRVISNIKTLLELKRKERAFFPQIDFHFIVCRENMKEVLPFIQLVASLDPSKSCTINFTRMLHPFEEVKELAVTVPPELLVRAEKKAKELGILIRWSANTAAIKPPIKKCTEWTMPFIFVDGSVIPCCAGNEANRRPFQVKHALGNIFTTGFAQIWRSENYQNLRKMLGNGKTPATCSDCCIYEVGESRSS